MNIHTNIPWEGALRPGDRVVYQPIINGRFGKIERSDVGTVEFGSVDLALCCLAGFDGVANG